jgi:hypothetical protein
MEKDCYQEIIDEVSKKLADKISSEEKGLAHRATLIDGDIADIVQDVGLKTCKQVLEKARNRIVKKKTKKMD